MRPTVLLLGFLLGVPSLLFAQTPFDPDLRFSRAFHRAGFNDFVRTSVEYQGNLVISGQFTQFNGKLLGRVARWSDGEWESLSFPDLAEIWVMAEYDGKLYAAGPGYLPNTWMYIYDGANWESVNVAFSGFTQTSVLALQEYEGVLHVGGDRLSPNSRGTAVWNEGALQDPGSSLPGNVLDFTLYNGNLIAVGGFAEEAGNGVQTVAAYDGSAWSGMGFGLGGGLARSAVAYAGDLIVAGKFEEAGGIPVGHVARFDGASWHAMGTLAGPPGSKIWDLEVFDGNLYAVRKYDSVLTEDPNILRWNGSEWEDAGNPLGEYRRMFTLRAFDGKLLAFGEDGVGAWDGAAWSPVGTLRDGNWLDDDIFDLTIFQGDLIACGQFNFAGGTQVNHVARWDGVRWQALGEGRPQTPTNLAVHDGSLYTGGTFSSFFKLGRWDGSRWEDLDTGDDTGRVSSMITFEGDLIVGGRFSSIGGVAAANVARWDGTAWHPLGDGVSDCEDVPSIATVADLAVFDGALYAAGTFKRAGSADVGHIAKWDGASWSGLGPMGGITDPCVIQWLDDVSSSTGIAALQPTPAGVFVGGHFQTVAGSSSPFVALWKDPGWLGLGENFQFTSWLEGLWDFEIHEDVLHAAGSVKFVGDGDFDRNPGVLVLVESEWVGKEGFPGWPSGVVRALASDGTFLYAGGSFREAGGIQSINILQWSETPVPVRLAVFTVHRTGKGAEIAWTPAELRPGVSFHVYRGPEDRRVRLSAEALRGLTDYVFLDPGPPAEATPYWLRETGRDGTVSWHGPVVLPAVAAGKPLLTVHPNPFGAAARISFVLSRSMPVRVDVFDFSGRRIRSLAVGVRGEGAHVVDWDGRSNIGTEVSSGIYFIRVVTADWSRTRRVVRVR